MGPCMPINLLAGFGREEIMTTAIGNAYGMIRWKQAADGLPDFGMTFGNPDFVVYARAYGLKGQRVESADGLAPTLEAAFAGGGVQLVTVPIDYSENIRVLVDELRENALAPD